MNALTRRQWTILLILVLSPFLLAVLLDLVNPLYESELFFPLIRGFLAIFIIVLLQGMAFLFLYAGFWRMNYVAHRAGRSQASQIREIILSGAIFVLLTFPSLVLAGILPAAVILIRNGITPS